MPWVKGINGVSSSIPELVFSTDFEDYEGYLTQITQRFGGLPFKGRDTFINAAVTVTDQQENNYGRMLKVLDKALKQIVHNYHIDEHIQRIFNLDPELDRIIKRVSGGYYDVGMYRPDIVFDATGQAKICEIGCRYPLNGWHLSLHANEVLRNGLAVHSENQLTNLDARSRFENHFKKRLDFNKPVFFVHDKEPGTEALRFFEDFKSSGLELIEVTPNDLHLKYNKLHVENQFAEQFILELDREELKGIDEHILSKLVGWRCVNDIRSLILVHDKRVLCALYDQGMMEHYLSREEYAILKPYLIPSYPLYKEGSDWVLNSTRNLILKKNSGGRGIDMYVKNDTDPEVWKREVTERGEDYMVQDYVDQGKFLMINGRSTSEFNLVGMLLCFDDVFFGTGAFRASSDSIINVHSGGTIIPSVISR